ncbi:polyphenol oxidase [Altererythrobacter sp. B11]|uniref:peptidoglycan editing factor PgeF n=1 Tax=Altererythrobacter sp. B11 TaxID=2060312 RepID=UPI000DC71362|nr:peptidoglycan editing factor PgeF [Altererythrobacter sp. B11]BBC71359.1 polyphenol oxidase [Altererythrobacter sp. B11]
MPETLTEQGVRILRSGALAGIPHGFLGREGGVSRGLVEGLNVGLGAGDDPAAVAENRRRTAAAVLPGAKLVTCYQVHSADAVVVDEPWSEDARPRADALVTARMGMLLAVVTADCAPVLLADREAGVIAAAHAGWRGAHGGVLEATVVAMEGLGADRSRIAAAIGPAIAQPSYEVDAAFRENFTEADEDLFAEGRTGHWQFDLEGYAARRLEGAGVGRIDRLGVDTYAAPQRYFSYRRSTHQQEPTYGRQFSLIGLI